MSGEALPCQEKCQLSSIILFELPPLLAGDSLQPAGDYYHGNVQDFAGVAITTVSRAGAPPRPGNLNSLCTTKTWGQLNFFQSGILNMNGSK